MSYQVKLDVFEGPFDLLLNLISKHELDVYKIPLAQIISDYLGFIREAHELDLEIASEFLVIAAILLDIKTSRLLPDEEEPEEEMSQAEAREILTTRLIEYKKFKNVSKILSSRFESEKLYYRRFADIEERFAHLQPDFLSKIDLKELALLVFELESHQRATIIDSRHITSLKINLSEKIGQIRNSIKSKKRTTFRQITSDCQSRAEFVVCFLAILELYKESSIDINQAFTFGDIEIEFKSEREVS